MWNKVVALLFSAAFVVGRERSSLEELTHTCLDGKHHKSAPGPENSLFNFCSPWKDRSCCTNETSSDLHVSPAWLNMNLDHCADLSPKCRQHFLQDLCFYQCSPNVGPWLEPVKKKLSNEKFMHAPLCETDCRNWWDDCKDDMTCIANWGENFNWINGSNHCPAGKPCKKFTEVFQNATDFCQVIWNYSWKVVPDNEPCMHLWFDPKDGNPNDKVAMGKALEILGLNEARSMFSSDVLLMSLVSLFISCLVSVY